VKPVALTFERFASMCQAAECARRELPLQVQFRKAGTVLCGQVLDAKAGHGGSTVDFFQVRSELGVSWVPHAAVRACSGVDGRCVCEGEAATRRNGARVSATGADGARLQAPHGNTGVAA